MGTPGGLLFPGGHGECVGGAPPLLPGSIGSEALGLWGAQVGEGVSGRLESPREGSPCLREAPAAPQLTADRAKPTVAWSVRGSLSPPFCTPHVCGQEEEGRWQACRHPGQALSQQAGGEGQAPVWAHVLLSLARS